MQPVTRLDLPNISIIKGVDFTNAIIANKNRIYLIGRITEYEDGEELRDSETRKPIFKLQLDAASQKQLQLITTLTGYTSIKACMSYNPTEQCILYANKGDSFSIIDTKITNEEFHMSYGKSQCIDGTLYYAMSERLLATLGMGAQGPEYDYPEEHEEYRDQGFDDIDGFNKNHIYAVGGKGDVWRYVEGIWSRCGFPSNEILINVCCGKDGLVYIAGLMGVMYVGKEDNWIKLDGVPSSLSFKNMVWYDDKVWATNDYGVWWITPNGIVRADLPVEVTMCEGQIHTSNDMLVLSGLGGIAFHKDDEWYTLR